ncbi:MAG: ABC transporter ATP-binding protein [Desulfovibrionales bacterium]|nr:ABC transporter ATP-binding protein [Desulfovibrionales bacterium]
MTSEYSVSVSELVKRFGDFTAVDRVSFNVGKGEIFGFLGPNGAGKSTTIRMLCGLISPTGGNGTVGGFDIVRESQKIKEHIGYMSQKFSLYDDLKVGENLAFFGGVYGLSGQKLEKRTGFVLDFTALSEKRESVTATLATGWKQRLALGCAILHEPAIVFLDEPTSGVDPLSRRRFWDLIYLMASQGVTVFVTTHYMDEAEYCDQLALIYRGRLIALGSPQELKSRYMQETILEVACHPLVEALEALQGGLDTAIFGNTLHVKVQEPVSGQDAIRERLAGSAIEVQNIRAIVPSLEDVFVTLIEQEDAKESSRVQA